MAYTPPNITDAGLTIPSFNDIFNLLLTQFQAIYGETVDLEPSNPDYQLISILALAWSDTLQLMQSVFNNMSPNFATGVGLSSLVKINGLTRKVPSASTCLVTLTGVAGTVVSNGVVQDVNGINWNLPNSVTIGIGGMVQVTATCSQLGAVNALASQITSIQTPTAGWTSVTNGSNVAVLGQPVETDAQLRARQMVSVGLPALTPLGSTVAALAAIEGVTRYYVEENPTGSTDSNGCPPHSITAVVEGGANLDIATAIYNKKTLGCLANGSTTVVITDPTTGNTESISFDRPTDTDIYVIVNAHPIAGGTLNSAQISAIQTAIVNYLNSLQIGAVISFGELVQAAASINANPDIPTISIRSPFFFGTSSSPSTSTDVALAFNAVAVGIAANVTVNSV